MGQIRTLGACSAVSTASQPTPVVLAAAFYNSSSLAVPGVVVAASSFAISKNIATIFLGTTLPTNGYNGPNGYIPTPVATSASATQAFNSLSGAPLNIQGVNPAPNGQQVTLWGFTTATYFNGKRISVIDNNPAVNSFRFYFTHGDVAVTGDAGKTAPSPFQHYRAIRLECSQNLGTDLIYVGDLNVSSTQYMACLSLAGQLSIEIASENIPPEGVFIATNGASTANDQVQVTILY
jgi:hypothetical protein